MNNTITEIKNILEGINSRIYEAEESINGPDDRMVEITAEEQNKAHVEAEANKGDKNCNYKKKFSGCLGLVHWDDLEGWYREGGGRGVQDGEHVYTHGGFMLMCGRTHIIL